MRDPLRQPGTPRGQEPRSSTDPTTDPRPSSPAIIRRRSSVSSSFVLGSACGRSNWTPPTRRRQTGQLSRKTSTTVSPGSTTTARGARTVCALDTPGPHGCCFCRRAGGTRTRDPGIMRATSLVTLANSRLHQSGTRPLWPNLATSFDAISWHEPWHNASETRCSADCHLTPKPADFTARIKGVPRLCGSASRLRPARQRGLRPQDPERAADDDGRFPLRASRCS